MGVGERENVKQAIRWILRLGWIVPLLLQSSCVVLPVKVAGGVSGQVVDRQTGTPLADALVVVRFEGHYDDILPDRALLGHREARTDSTGHFSIGAIVRPGFSAWPMFRGSARVVSVLKDGYRCASPHNVPRDGDVRIVMDGALDEHSRRRSCRPVPAKRGEAVEYQAAWRQMFPATPTAMDRETTAQIDATLKSRGAFGFGQNCHGPALDLAMSPDGRLAAFSIAGATETEVRVLELRGSRVLKAKTVAQEAGTPTRRLAWTSPGDLVLWEPAPQSQRVVSPSAFSTGRFERVWSRSGPAKAATDAATRPRASSPLEPTDWTDEDDTRWLGRSFQLAHLPDAKTGLPSDELRVHREDGSIYTLSLPGEPCGPPGRFGRPQYRIAADGRTSLDLRFVEGGCHIVRTDLENGSWSILDGVKEPAICSASRRVPASHFSTALRGYVHDIELAVTKLGADPASAYALRIEADGSTQLDTRGFSGEVLTGDLPPFPLKTPLRRIEVSILGSVPRVNPTRGVPGLQPL